MMMFIGPRHSSGAHNSRAPLQWHAQMKVFFQGDGVAGFVDSWPETLVPSASNRSTPVWTLVDSCQSATRERNAGRSGPAAGMRQDVAGDEARAGRTQEADRGAELGALAEAAERDLRRHLGH